MSSGWSGKMVGQRSPAASLAHPTITHRSSLAAARGAGSIARPQWPAKAAPGAGACPCLGGGGVGAGLVVAGGDEVNGRRQAVQGFVDLLGFVQHAQVVGE